MILLEMIALHIYGHRNFFKKKKTLRRGSERISKQRFRAGLPSFKHGTHPQN